MFSFRRGRSSRRNRPEPEDALQRAAVRSRRMMMIALLAMVGVVVWAYQQSTPDPITPAPSTRVVVVEQ